PVESHHTPISAPSTSQPPTSPPSMPTTYVAEEAATMPHDSPLLIVHLIRSDEGSMTLNELTVLCTTLSKKVETLESDLKQTKLTYGAAYTKLIMKVKKLEHKGRKITQIDEDEGITLVQMSAQTQGRHEHDFEEHDFKFIAPEEDYIVKPDISTTMYQLALLMQKYMHDPLKWKLYDTCVVHHVSTERGHDIFMLVEKDYPLTRALMTLMLSNKLQVDEYSVMADELLRKIFILANKPRQ
ncbi:hypothetical protein Tco_1451715, partial [Tanacetum coccineum]